MDFTIKTMAEYAAEGKSPEVLFWVGCAGSFDDRAKKITKAFAKILNKVGVEFAVLGQEESCTGDPAKRAGNEFLFQMQAMMNIEALNAYEVKKIVQGKEMDFICIFYSYGYPDHFFVCATDPDQNNPTVYGTDHEMYFQEIENEGKLEEFLDRFMTQKEFLETVKEYLARKMTE